MAFLVSGSAGYLGEGLMSVPSMTLRRKSVEDFLLAADDLIHIVRASIEIPSQEAEDS